MFLLMYCLKKGVIIMSKKLEIMEMVKEAFQNGFINDHNDQDESIQYVGILTIPWRSKIYVVPLYPMCCLNPLYYNEKDGRLHLSTSSVAGTINARNHRGNMQAAVDEFNRDRLYSRGVEGYCPFESLMLISREDWEAKQKRMAKYENSDD